ncbi:DNA polymerase III subunit delta' [Mesobacterium pallidum]|uniref:DNA polymerase III subunit delta' n=1 Tax=Mesobacterium pallidum TaxID=2872037 RepID=UPI001EE33EA7|nr:DNA polymerase III subunit delta' [Mesobacterium pallidum]
MSDPSDLPEPDRLPGAPHPRDTAQLFGQARAEADFLEAYTTGRLHHGWLLTGLRGTGKATLAWRIARFLLATPPVEDDGLFGAPPPPETLDIAYDHPVATRMRALTEPGLFLLRRGPNDKGDRISDEIRVTEVRKLKGFFSLSAADGGRRVVIVDSADDLNVSSANAILKLLEEPPARTTLLLIAHQPARLLPTIRSRCRELRLGPLGPEPMRAALDQAGIALPDDTSALTELSAGSVGEAVRLVNEGGLPIYAEIVAVLGSLPRLDRGRALALAELAAARSGEKFPLFLHLFDLSLSRLARSAALGQPLPEAAPGEAAAFARLAPVPRAARAWAEAAQATTARMAHGRAVNIDPASLVLDTFFKLQATADA